MTRIRTIKPEFFNDETIRSLSSDGARLFFVNLLQHADDEGRFRWAADMLGGYLFRDRGPEHIAELLVELHRHELVDCYVHEGREVFGQVTNFLRHQAISKPRPSEFPAPDAEGCVLVQPPELPVQRRKQRPREPAMPRFEEAMRWDDPACALLPFRDGQAPPVKPHGTAKLERVQSANPLPDGNGPSSEGMHDPFGTAPHLQRDSWNAPGGLPEGSRNAPGGLPEGSRWKGREKVNSKRVAVSNGNGNGKNSLPPCEDLPVKSAHVRTPAREGGGFKSSITTRPEKAITDDDKREAARFAVQLAGDRRDAGLQLARLTHDQTLWRAFDQQRIPEYLDVVWLAWGPGHPRSGPETQRQLACKVQAFLRDDLPRHRLERLGHLVRTRQHRARTEQYIPRDRVRWLVEDDWSDVPSPALALAQRRQQVREHFTYTPSDPLPEALAHALPAAEVEQLRQQGLADRDNPDLFEPLPENCQPGYWERNPPCDLGPVPGLDVDALVREELELEARERARSRASQQPAPAPRLEPTAAQLDAARADIEESLVAGLATPAHHREVIGSERFTALVRECMQARRAERLAVGPQATESGVWPLHGESPQDELRSRQAAPERLGELIGSLACSAPGGDAE